MMHVLTRRTLLALALFLLAACGDNVTLTDSPAPEATSLQVNLSTEAWGSRAPADPALVRIRIRDSGGSILRTLNLNHSGPLDRSFGPFQVEDRLEALDIGTVEVEVLGSGAVPITLWSGRTEGPSVEAGSTGAIDLVLYPGPLSNLELTALELTGGEATVGTGEVFQLGVTASGGSPDVPFWGSLDPDVVSVSTSGEMVVVGSGAGRVVVAAGLRADTLVLDARALEGSIEVEPGSVTFEQLRTFQSLTAVVRDFRGNVMDGAEVVWSSSNVEVAPVDALGRVSARRVGTATVEARAGNVSVDVPVVVGQVPNSIQVLPEAISLVPGQDLRLSVSVRDPGGIRIDDADIDFAIGDGAIARMISTTRIEGISPGTTTLTISAGNLSREIPVEVLPGEPSSLAVIGGVGQSATVGDELGLPIRIRIRDSNGFPVPGLPVSWAPSGDAEVLPSQVSTTDDEGIATVRWIMGTTPGAYTLTASAPGAGSVDIGAQAVTGSAASAQVIPADTTLRVGDQTPLAAQVRDSFQNIIANPDLTWASDDESVVTVSSAGVLEAVGPGNAVITATSGTVTGTATIVVLGPASVEVSPADTTLNVGDQASLTAQVRDQFQNPFADPELTWSSDDESVATVSSEGLVEGVGPGNAVITATSGTVTGTATVEVLQPVPGSRSFDPASQQRIEFSPADFSWGDDTSGGGGLVVWVRPASVTGPGFQYVLSSTSPFSGNGINLYYGESGSGNPFWHVTAQPQGSDVGASGIIILNSLPAPQAGVWHQVIIRRVPGTTDLEITIDGQTVTRSTGASTSNFNFTNQNMWIGGRPDMPTDRYFNGEVAGLALITGEFSGAERDGIIGALDYGAAPFVDWYIPLGSDPEEVEGASFGLNLVNGPVVTGPVVPPSP